MKSSQSPGADTARRSGRFAAALAVVWCASCSPSDQFLGAQVDFQLRQGTTPTLDLAKVGPANWTRVCVLGPYTTDARAAELLGLPWAAERHTTLAARDDRVALVFTDGRKVLAFVERPRADGDFTTLAPACRTRESARLATWREAGGRLRFDPPSSPGQAAVPAPPPPP